MIHFSQPTGLATGTPVVYTALGSPIGGLTSGDTYYVISIDPYDIELATTADNAASSVAQKLDASHANGVQSITPTAPATAVPLSFTPSSVEATVLTFTNRTGSRPVRWWSTRLARRRSAGSRAARRITSSTSAPTRSSWPTSLARSRGGPGHRLELLAGHRHPDVHSDLV